MEKPQYHILVCSSFRLNGEAKGVCHKKGATDLPQYLENEILDRGIDAMVSTTSCFKMCGKGPVMTIYPNGWWYDEVDEEKIDEILDALQSDQPATELLMA